MLLVHGTGVTGDENWSVSYRPQLVRRGHSVCTVDMPNYGYGDVQVTVETVVSAIRQMHRTADRKISIIGHSQGALQPVFALRVWPDLARYVDDFVGLAGVYDRGSAAISEECDPETGCAASYHQMAAGSKFLDYLSRRALPTGPSYTAIGTNLDRTVTPQPAANRIRGMRSIQIEDVCPGRAMPTQDHVMIAGDAVAWAIAVDALSHRGPADPARIDRGACSALLMPGVNLVRVVTLLPGLIRQGEPTLEEPRVRCYLRPRCAARASFD